MDQEQVQQLLRIIENMRAIDATQSDRIDDLHNRIKMLEGLVAQMVKESGYDTREVKKDE